MKNFYAKFHFNHFSKCVHFLGVYHVNTTTKDDKAGKNKRNNFVLHDLNNLNWYKQPGS